ncbi:MAG: acyltransferase [Bacteroidales bacterium]|nr:acyltransferase [Bacteroidales bacterium]
MRIKGLDGIRAICAFVLLWGHLTQEEFATWIDSNASIRMYLPACCAYVFFVISGFLAGYKQSNEDSILTYYKKKAKRILPLYYLYVIIVIGAFAFIGRINEVLNDSFWWYLFLMPNVPFCGFFAPVLPLVHLWFIGSLLLFYLTFPIVKKFCGEKLLNASVIIAIVWALTKWMIYWFIGKETFIYRLWGTAGLDCMFAGVALGILVRKKNKLINIISKSNLLSVLTWLLFIMSGLYGMLIPSPVRVEYIAILACVLIISQLSENPIINLDNKVFDWLGSISYEIYVIQILIIILLSELYMSCSLCLPAVLIYAIVTIVVIFFSWGIHWLLGKIVR